MEVEAFDEGVLLGDRPAEGEAVPVNAIVRLGRAKPGEAVPDDAAAPAAAGGRRAAARGSPRRPVRRRSRSAAVVRGADRPAIRDRRAAAATRPPRHGRISPRASRVAADAGIDPRTISGTGPGGRIVERDVQAAIAARPSRPLARARRGARERGRAAAPAAMVSGRARRWRGGAAAAVAGCVG